VINLFVATGSGTGLVLAEFCERGLTLKHSLLLLGDAGSLMAVSARLDILAVFLYSVSLKIGYLGTSHYRRGNKNQCGYKQGNILFHQKYLQNNLEQHYQHEHIRSTVIYLNILFNRGGGLTDYSI
jgi:hypothetical protein